MSDEQIESGPQPRLSVQLEPELKERLSKHIPRGVLSIVVTILLEDLVDQIDRDGSVVLGKVLAKKYNILEDRKEE